MSDIPPPVANSSWLARFYTENRVLLDRLLFVVITTILSYFGFDKLNTIENKTDTAAEIATVAKEEAEKSSTVGLESKVIGTQLAVDRGLKPEAAVEEAKAELHEHKVAANEAAPGVK